MFERAVYYFNRMEAEGLTRDEYSYNAMQQATSVLEF